MFIKNIVLSMVAAPFAILASSLAFAATTGPLSLQQAVDMALQNNRLLLAQEASLDEASARSDQADGMLLPRLSASSGVSRTNSPLGAFGSKLQQQRITSADFAPATLNTPAYINNYRNAVTLEAPLYQGGRNWSARERAAQSEQAAEEQLNLVRQQVAFDVVRAYTNVLRLHSRETAAQSAVEASESHLKQTAALLDRGIGIQSDILDAKAHLSDTRLALTRTRNARLRAQEELARLLGDVRNADLALQGTGQIDLKGSDNASMDESIIDSHPRLIALQHQLDAAHAGIGEASAGLLPHVGLVATQEWNNNTLAARHSNTSIGAEVSINLFAGGSDMAARRAAEASYAHLQYRLQDERVALLNDLSDARRGLDEAIETAAARRDTLRQSTESLRIQKLRYEQGLEKSTDVLDAHTRNDHAVANDIDARFNLIVSRAALLLAAGRLTPEVFHHAQ